MGCSRSFEEVEYPENISEEVLEKSKNHPCYSASAKKAARMHIPVAPKCNISCNYCNRKYDCLHETRPGVTSEVLTPEEALEKYLLVKEKVDNLRVVGIAGPGDALANFEDTKRSIELIREADPDITFCLSTNGLRLPEYAEDIAKLGVSHITITINTIDPKIGASIYKYINYNGKFISGEEGAKILIDNQLEGLKALSKRDVLCKVNIVMIKGINEDSIPEVVEKVKEYGAFMTNIMPLIPAEGSDFEDVPLTSNKELNSLRDECSMDLKQMYHCQQCRADAIGQLSNDRSLEFRNKDSLEENSSIGEEEKEETFFAIASKTGKLIDLHFGHAMEFFIYKHSQDGIKFMEKRSVDKYCTGKECEDTDDKMARMLELLSDCKAILSVRMGHDPTKIFKENGIESIEVYDLIEKGIKYAMDRLG